MSDEQKMVREFMIYWADERATAQYPEAAFGFRVGSEIDFKESDETIQFRDVSGAWIRIYKDKLLWTVDRFVPEKPPTPTASKQP